MRLPKNIRFFVILALVFGAMVFFEFLGLLTPIKNGFSYVVTPVQTHIYSITLKIKSFLPSNQGETLEYKNQELQDRINQLVIENSELKNQLNLSKEIQDQLKFIQGNGLSSISAKVFGKSSDTRSQVLLVNKGTSDGVILGAPVIASGGIFVGQIIESNAFSSQALLATDNHSQVSSAIQNETNSPGLTLGQHGLSLKIEFIPQLENAAHGQTVITSGSQDHIPKGLVIGLIDEVSKPVGELFQNATIHTLIDYNKLEVVSIILQPPQ